MKPEVMPETVRLEPAPLDLLVDRGLTGLQVLRGLPWRVPGTLTSGLAWTRRSTMDWTGDTHDVT